MSRACSGVTPMSGIALRGSALCGWRMNAAMRSGVFGSTPAM